MFRSTRLLRQRLDIQGLEKRFGQIQVGKSIQRSFSSVDTKKKEQEEETSNPKQPFVTASLEPGEWDINRTDPFFRPKPQRSKMISAEDYANRPPVGFENEFSTFEDSMVSLSWLDSKTSRQIYQIYVDMMVLSQREHKTTSHEYVCRVIAQKFNITPMRAAAVIQLQHSEEQLRRHHPELLCEEQANYAEQAILQNIRDAYRAERSQVPRGFVEDPVGSHGRGEPDETSKSWVKTDDIFDLEERVTKANVRDEERARILIDGHVYKEDVDESEVVVKTDGVSKRLIKAQKEQQKEVTESESIPFPETNAKGIKRPRWKFAAQVVNTRARRKKGRRLINYTNNNVENTLIEHDGELRVATVEEAKQVAWKPSRSKDNEYIYEDAKKAWLKKTLQGKTDVWGRAPVTKAAPVQPEKPKAKKEDEDMETESKEKEDSSAESNEKQEEEANEEKKDD